MACTSADIDHIVGALTDVRSFDGRVWRVEFGAGRSRYQLMYDTGEVALHIHGSLQALVREAIGRALTKERLRHNDRRNDGGNEEAEGEGNPL